MSTTVASVAATMLLHWQVCFGLCLKKQFHAICLRASFFAKLVYHNQSRTGHYSPSFRSFSIMGQSDPEYSEFGTVLADGGDRFAVSAICFDSQEELLWMGNAGVRVIVCRFVVYIPCIELFRLFHRVMLHPTLVLEWTSTRPFRFMHPSRCVKSWQLTLEF